MAASLFPALDRAGRRQALRGSSLAIAVLGAADLAVSHVDAFRVAVWTGWVAVYLLGALVVERGPSWVPHAIAFLASSAAVLSLFLLAAAGGGSHSLFFQVATMVPILSVTFSPDDMVGAGVQGALVLVAGVLLQAGEGQPLSRLVLFGVMVVVVTASAIQASRGHRRSVDRLLSEQARAARHEVDLERARQQAERWSSLAKLAEGVAHDVNSPVGSLRSNLGFVREELAAGRGADREVAAALEDSLQALERIRETVASLTAISVPGGDPAGPAGAGAGAPRAEGQPLLAADGTLRPRAAS